MYLCEECGLNDGVVYIDGIVICDSCFTDIFGMPWKAVAASAKYCPSCESKVAGRHRCKATSIDADKLLAAIPVKEKND